MLRSIILLFLFVASTVLRAQDFIEEIPVNLTPDDPAYAMCRKGDTVYMGGGFAYLGVKRPYLAVIDSVNGTAMPLANLPNDKVHAMTADGNGGWFIGGEFTMIGDSARHGLAQIDSLGNVSSWNPNPIGFVYTLNVVGNQLFVGGDFTQIASVTRIYVASFDCTTLLLTTWNTTMLASTNQGVTSSAVKGDTIYFAGGFSFANFPLQHNNIVGVSVATGALNHTNLPRANSYVSAIHIFNNKLYLSGTFVSVTQAPNTNITRNRTACFDLVTDLVTGWNPALSSGYFLDIDDDGTDVIVAGAYTNSPTLQPFVCAVDAVTGLLTSNPINDLMITRDVHDLERRGNFLYIGGNMTQTINGDIPPLIMYDLVGDSIVTSFNPHIGRGIFCMSNSNGRILAGGQFQTSDAVRRNGIAAFRFSDHTLLPWDPQPKRVSSYPEIHAIATSGNLVYIGGYFDSLAGQPHANLAALDCNSAAATNWYPQVSYTIEPLINTILIDDGRIFFGGAFTGVNSQPRNNAAVFDTAGNLLSWAPNFDNFVGKLVSLGTNIVAQGNFANVNNLPHEDLALFNRNTLALSAWNPAADQNIWGVTTDGVRLFVYGEFAQISGQNRSCIAAYDSSSVPQLLNWGSSLAFNNAVTEVFISSRTIYAVGTFTTVSNQSRPRFCSFDAVTGQLLQAELPCFPSPVLPYTHMFDNRIYISSIASGNAVCNGMIYTLVGYDIGRNTITGKAFEDYNFNGVQDTLEPNRGNMLMNLQPTAQFVATDAAGNYRMLVDTSSAFVVTALPGPYTISSIPASHNAPITMWIVDDSLNDFGIVEQTNIRDLRIAFVALNQPTRGFTASYLMSCKNVGTVTQNAFATLHLPSGVSFVNANIPPDYNNSIDTVRWNLNALLPGEQRNIFIDCHLSAALPLSSIITYNAQIDSLIFDVFPPDNTTLLHQNVVGSYDPNFKAVAPQDSIQSLWYDDYLTYTVHFQNTGTAPAVNIVVIDTIDAGFDIATFEFLANSHACTWFIEGRALRVDFQNIMLVDSFASYTLSQGYFVYRLKTFQPASVVQAVANTAHIYFDFNDPIITNTTTTYFSTVTEIENAVSRPLISLFPNPSNGAVTLIVPLESFSGTYEVVDVIGRSVQSGSLNGSRNEIDIEGLAPGYYSIRVLQNNALVGTTDLIVNGQ